MRCRNIVKSDDTTNVVWFGSYGLNDDGTAKFAKPDKSSYESSTDGVVASLTQRLSVIKTELWFNYDYGLPLLDKDNTKVNVDAAVANIVLSHEDVQSISSFVSSIEKNVYTCIMTIETLYGEISVTI